MRAWRQVVARDLDRAGRPPIPHLLQGDMTVDIEHASSMGGGTLCGIPEAEIDLYRHLVDPNGPGTCAACSAIAGGRC
jgi:hypothetical protein